MSTTALEYAEFECTIDREGGGLCGCKRNLTHHSGKAQERGFELPALPEGESCAVRWLCFAALPVRVQPAGEVGSRPFSQPLHRRRGAALVVRQGCELAAGTTRPRRGRDAAQHADPPPFDVGRRTRRESVSAGWYHSVAITADGAVWSWGGGVVGQLGHGDRQDQLLPKKIEALAGQRVVAVSAGNHSLALTADGALWSWGWGGFGSLGHGDELNRWQPKKIEAFAGQCVVAVSAQPATVSPSPPTELSGAGVWEPVASF